MPTFSNYNALELSSVDNITVPFLVSLETDPWREDDQQNYESHDNKWIRRSVDRSTLDPGPFPQASSSASRNVTPRNPQNSSCCSRGSEKNVISMKMFQRDRAAGAATRRTGRGSFEF